MVWVLVLNAGSSSIKYSLFKMPEEDCFLRGNLERIGERFSFIKHMLSGSGPFQKRLKIAHHREGINFIFSLLLDKEKGVLKNLKEISGVGHRVVHGGEVFRQPCIINKKRLLKIKEYSILAPLHNPPQVSVIEACLEYLKGIPQVAVFDTAFHSTLPKYAFLYGLPYELYEKFGIRKYGFHGISHQYVAEEAGRRLKRPLQDLKIITCHLGNGCSITAVKGGKSIDTSMGFTPLEGVMMGTRPGDFDPSIILFLLKKGYSIEKIDHLLNKKSGLLGLSGVSNDMRDIMRQLRRNNLRAQIACDVFVYRIQKYIGAYVGILGGLDALVFTAGIGENQKELRERICKGLNFLLKATGARVLVIHTDEEQSIARQAYALLKNEDKSK
ncbi:MAG: acetate kinase [Candidatus Omnitrophica bacterium]|nr:acetate kinase [Candidatus Omnitrophota bacterium]MCM8793268.1 acetate kinase [Candidatus Omnitrophota bacterium]